MKTKSLTFLLVLTFLFLFSGSSVVFADDLQDGLTAYKKRDYKTAIKLWMPLAKKGNSEAQFYMGHLYHQGDGVPRNYKEHSSGSGVQQNNSDLKKHHLEKTLE